MTSLAYTLYQSKMAQLHFEYTNFPVWFKSGEKENIQNSDLRLNSFKSVFNNSWI